MTYSDADKWIFETEDWLACLEFRVRNDVSEPDDDYDWREDIPPECRCGDPGCDCAGSKSGYFDSGVRLGPVRR